MPVCRGLSPRTRGSRLDHVEDARLPGPIPADAGEPQRRGVWCSEKRAYPRGRGGARSRRSAANPRRGLSPRTRGSHRCARQSQRRTGPIPADAGEPTSGSETGRRRWAYPRGRGGAVAARLFGELRQGLSPRTRGSRPRRADQVSRWGPIPADAGEPRQGWSSRRATRAYPRGRGGAVRADEMDLAKEGLSPRTRGSQLARPKSDPDVGPIPADAGEPWECARRPAP